MGLHPFLYFLFRTEEIVHSSTASQKDPRRGGVEFLHQALFKDQTDVLAAVLGSVFDAHPFVAPFRVDQRDEIQRSIRIQPLEPRHLHAVVHEVDAR